MKAVIQRSTGARVAVKGTVTGEITDGIVVLLGVTHEDTAEDAVYLAKKVAHLRIFEDENNKMNLSLKDKNGSVLSISQFTLYGDTRKGRRPNFMAAARPEQAKKLYEVFNRQLEVEELSVQTGVFGEMMAVDLQNDGPVTLILDSKEK